MPLPAPEPSTLTVMRTEDAAVEVMASSANFFGETSVSIRRKNVHIDLEDVCVAAVFTPSTEQV